MSSGHSGDPGSSASSAEGTAALVLIAGVVLAIGVLAFALVSTDDLARSIVTGLVFLYPAAAYAIDRDDDPTNFLPPVPVTVAAGLVAGIVATLSFVSGTGPTLDRTLYGCFSRRLSSFQQQHTRPDTVTRLLVLRRGPSSWAGLLAESSC